MAIIPPGEKIMETKSCKSCGADFAITDRDLEFYDRVSPVFNGKKEVIPPPTLCPDCRQRRRLAFRNERKLYKRTCDLTGADIVSIHVPGKTAVVYSQSAWWGDGWNALNYGRDFDFGRSFAEQFSDLWQVVPCKATTDFNNNENSEYGNSLFSCKNAYLCYWSDYLQDAAYCHASTSQTDALDIGWSLHGEHVYQTLDSVRTYSSHHIYSSSDVRDCAYLDDCIDCKRCFFSVGLRNKQHYFRNEPYPPEEYERLRREFAVADPVRTLEEFRSYRLGFPVAMTTSIESDRCFGSIFVSSEDCFDCYNITEGKNLRYVVSSGMLEDCRDIYGCGYASSLLYEGQTLGINSMLVCMSEDVTESYEARYCIECVGLKFCFACIWLRHKQYCILNKQYTEEEYNILVPKIIAHMRSTGEWGEFFSPSISPFGYNETIAQEYFPLTKEEAIRQWFNWSDYEPPFPKVDKIIPASKLPEKIEDIPDDILNWAIECEITKKPYRIIKQELDFYRKHHLPIPRRHPDQRHLDRLALRNPRKLHERNCDNCGKHMITTYAPDRPERVYCEECYRREVYG